MILERLRSETKAAHQALEKQIVLRIKQVQTPQDYTRLLELFYGYFHPLESILNTYLDNSSVPFYDVRRKSDRLVNDIQASGGNPAHPLCTNLPAIKNVTQAIGAMYVMEGSTLGGQIISTMIKERLQLSSNESLSFFMGYGAQTEEMWSSFSKALINQAINKQAEDEIVTAANETFKKFITWVYDEALPAEKQMNAEKEL